MIVLAGKNDIAVHGLFLAMEYFDNDNIIVIVSKNDIGVDGWQRSLLKVAKEKNIAIKTLEEVYDSKISVFLSLEFDQIIKPKRLKTDKVYNIHFSELPRYKGMYTSVWPILYADSTSGVTKSTMELILVISYLKRYLNCLSMIVVKTVIESI